MTRQEDKNTRITRLVYERPPNRPRLKQLTDYQVQAEYAFAMQKPRKKLPKHLSQELKEWKQALLVEGLRRKIHLRRYF